MCFGGLFSEDFALNPFPFFLLNIFVVYGFAHERKRKIKDDTEKILVFINA